MPPDATGPLTGRLMTVLRPDVVAALKQRASLGPLVLTDLTSLDGPGPDALRRVLQQFSAAGYPAIRSIGPADIAVLDRAAQAGDQPPTHSLLSYWVIEPGPAVSAADRAALADALRGITDVFESVHFEEAVGEPPINWRNDKYARQQFYLKRGPTGIDAKHAWTRGADGTGIAFADLEMGWNLDHEDYKSKMPAALLCHQQDPAWVDHGTGVLGIVVASDNTKGVIGIAPGVTTVLLASHWDGASREHVADAVAAAAVQLAFGDVLLLEVQKADSGPIELLAGGAEMTAIQAATSKGIIVVEPAGNGGRSLDPDFPRSRADSGAIMVGASVGADPPASMQVQPHERHGVSNYGARVDCYAPGVGLVTTGRGDLDSGRGDPNRMYSGVFRHTSGASAVVAGAAILAQHLNLKATGARLGARALRGLLTAQGRVRPVQDGEIGVMPDLRRIANQLFGSGTPA